MNIKPVPAKAAKLSRLNAVGLDLVVERLASDAEAFGGFEFVAAGFLEHLDDGVAFHSFEQSEAGVIALFGLSSPDRGGDRQIRRVHFLGFAQQYGALDFVLQLA